MKHSIRVALGALSLVAVCVIPTAAAAEGELIVDGTDYGGTSGCIDLGPNAPRKFKNNSDRLVTIYMNTHCVGAASGILRGRSSGTYTGSSMLRS
ncbi:hypothetical protein F3087_35605 [Nocardia colli]|uniref:DUF2690 domain-containing protein n=1 Tax=Nocardia colli TaxID=2545717 RepID=A0A5N0E3K2_9NOCA|nr:hypothetical protein [Nocardia colli]KAA8883998.1 hypothetical protein F3087_35605 [Nocardia colli]